MIYIDSEGGLGNQLFRWAAARALQLDTGEPITIYDYHLVDEAAAERSIEIMTPPNEKITYLDLSPDSPPVFKMVAPIRSFFYLALHKGYRILFRVHSEEERVRMERRLQSIWNLLGFAVVGTRYIPIKRHRFPRNYFCMGYYFSSRYFGCRGEQIRRELTHPELIGEKNKDLLAAIRASNSVAVHIRLGDYVSPKWASGIFVCDAPYFYDAMEAACAELDDPTFFIFTNDRERASQMSFPPKAKVIFCPSDNSAVQDLQLMAQCNHFIISNSTFSWWGSFLGTCPDKKVYAPDIWYRDGTPTDLYEPGWTKIHVELPKI